MELILTDEQQLLADSAGKFFARAGGVKRARALRGSEAGFDRESLRAMADSGWLGMLVAENCGGQQLGPRAVAPRIDRWPIDDRSGAARAVRRH